MNRRQTRVLPALALAAGIYLQSHGVTAATSQWAHIDSAGKLAYQPLPGGDHIMDFSHAGYMGGGIKLPDVTTRVTISPSGGDDTTAIQNGIDQVSRLDLHDGFRGGVLLTPGIYRCRDTLKIVASGVVLRGSGSGEYGSTIQMTGSPHLCFSIGGKSETKFLGLPVAITSTYVPAGAASFHINQAGYFQPGDYVIINRPATPAWVKFMGMDNLVRNGKPEHWVSGEMHTERVVQNSITNFVTLDVPLADSFDARWLNPPGGSLVKTDRSARLTQIGVENLRIQSPPQAVTINQPHNQALQLDGVSDAWVRNLEVENSMNSFHFGEHSSRLTIEQVHIQHTVASIGAAKPVDFWAGGTQTLLNRCSASGDNLFYFSTGARMMGPVVVLNGVFHGNGHIQPHMRWGTGLLVDNCQVPESGIEFMNRGIMGSGHGWTIGWSVAWNCTAKSFIIQQPPGSMNWAIGCQGKIDTATQPGDTKGPILPSGIFDAHGTHVAPASLYLAQLQERLGPSALTNVGY
ncbi:MAG: hypothetical protein WCS94_07700 [Verrucomicrobiota bacterium]